MRAKSRPMSVRGAGEEVAHAAYRLDEARFLGVGLELGADLRDVHVDGAVEGLRMPLERVEDLLAGQHAAGGPGEGGQELELVVGEDPSLTRHRHLARGEVELELADAQPRGWMRGGRAPQESADAGEELPWIEGLSEIVVGAHLEPHHLVHIFALGGEHDHGQGGTVGEGADSAAHLEAVHAGEHDIEEHDVGPALVEGGETARAVARQRHVDLVLAEVFRHEGAEAGVVIDQEGGGAARHGSYRITPPPIQCVARVKKCKGGPPGTLARDRPAQYYLTGYKPPWRRLLSCAPAPVRTTSRGIPRARGSAFSRRPCASSPRRASRAPASTASPAGRASTSGCSTTTLATRKASSARSSPVRSASARRGP